MRLNVSDFELHALVELLNCLEGLPLSFESHEYTIWSFTKSYIFSLKSFGVAVFLLPRLLSLLGWFG